MPVVLGSRLKAVVAAIDNTPSAIRARAFKRWRAEGWVEILSIDEWGAIAAAQQDKLVADAGVLLSIENNIC